MSSLGYPEIISGIVFVSIKIGLTIWLVVSINKINETLSSIAQRMKSIDYDIHGINRKVSMINKGLKDNDEDNMAPLTIQDIEIEMQQNIEKYNNDKKYREYINRKIESIVTNCKKCNVNLNVCDIDNHICEVCPECWVPINKLDPIEHKCFDPLMKSNESK